MRRKGETDGYCLQRVQRSGFRGEPGIELGNVFRRGQLVGKLPFRLQPIVFGAGADFDYCRIPPCQKTGGKRKNNGGCGAGVLDFRPFGNSRSNDRLYRPVSGGTAYCLCTASDQYFSVV